MTDIDEGAAAAIAAVDAAVKEARNDGYWIVTNGVLRIARAAGAQESERPRWPGAQTTMIVVEPVAGLRAAVRMKWAAGRVVDDHVAEARRNGVTWPVIGQVLGLEKEAEREGRPLGEVAYDAVAGEPDLMRDPVFYYTCGSCLKHVRDRGPYNRRPDDNERGHAADCARARAEMAAYEAEAES